MSRLCCNVWYGSSQQICEPLKSILLKWNNQGWKLSSLWIAKKNISLFGDLQYDFADLIRRYDKISRNIIVKTFYTNKLVICILIPVHQPIWFSTFVFHIKLGMQPSCLLLELLAWCRVFKSRHCNPFEDWTLMQITNPSLKDVQWLLESRRRQSDLYPCWNMLHVCLVFG